MSTLTLKSPSCKRITQNYHYLAAVTHIGGGQSYFPAPLQRPIAGMHLERHYTFLRKSHGRGIAYNHFIEGTLQ